MIKKVLASVTALAAAITLVSCGPQNSEFSGVKNSGECTITLSWWGGDERHEATKAAAELFESRHPEINVETEYGSWSGWKNKIFSQFESGECADVMQVNYDWLVSLSYDGSGFYDLEKLGKYIDLENFDKSILEFGRRNGVLNAVPASVTGRTLFYNKNAFESAGAELPETWDDLFTAAEKLNRQGAYPLEADNGSGFTAFYLAVVYEQQKTGHQFITEDGNIGFDVSELSDALSFYKSLQDAGVVRSVEMMNGENGNFNESDSWKNGKTAGIAEWGSSVSKYRSALNNPDSLVCGPLLEMDGAEGTGWMYKPSVLFAVNSKTEHPAESAMLLDFLLNDPDCARILGTTRGIPASASALEALQGTDMLSGPAWDSANILFDSKPVLISPYFENSEMQKYYRQAIESVSLGILSPEEAARGIYANIIYTLREIKEGLA